MVLSIDEKSQIRALDRPQPGLPIKEGRCATVTHDYKRNGTHRLETAGREAIGGSHLKPIVVRTQHP